MARGRGGGAIVGAAGLLLGMGKLRSMYGVSLLGESLGYIVDAKAAKSVLLAVTKILDLELDMTALEERARETEEILRKVQEMQRAMLEQGMPSTPPRRRTGGATSEAPPFLLSLLEFTSGVYPETGFYRRYPLLPNLWLITPSSRNAFIWCHVSIY